MKLNLQSALLIMCLTFIFSCKKQNKTFESLSKLQGNWKMEMGEDAAVIESWIKINDTLYTGKSYEVTKGDSVLSETVNLYVSGDEIFYVPVVQDQNQQQPVLFRLSGNEKDKFSFENPEHDFPTKIVYVFKDAKTMDATISGLVNGEMRSLEFNYIRTE